MTNIWLKLRPSAFIRALFIIYILFLWTPVSLKAQEKEIASFGKLSIGSNFINLDSFNEALEVNEFSGIGETFFAIGFSVDHFHGKWFLGGELYNYMVNESGEALKARDHAVLGFHYLSLKTGFVALSKPKTYAIYPTIGLGGGLANLQARKQSQNSPSIYWTKGFLVDMAIRADLFKVLDEEKSYFVTIGLSLGYLRKLGNDWLLDGFGQTDTGIPTTPQGLYIRASLGMGKMK